MTAPSICARITRGIERALKKRPAGENTYQWLSFESHVTVSHLYKIQRDELGDVGLKTVLSISRALGITVSELIGE